ncbi:GntR family transcriptional regulator [Actinoalloteichus caeruleus]|uniref:Transcriptional regulator, GntR family n=1 Tax=Actinoalloteichus caeruleus DSM 43889 TaxID=1120930 RepID=A0ABT1JCH5_ACTCY|nr:GntR family transcriptional regulator [Actinoalloteichus caeruleus]MCP2330197.1 transcriptional regulator, GntR family [Actinoalloteichus caeruleus DSM 43889]
MTARRPEMIPSRTEHVLGVIKSAILDGSLTPGTALVEQELAERLGVSKTPVREALKTLHGSGLVVLSPYRGATVARMSHADAVAVYDMRLLLEPEAVRRSVLAGGDLAEAAAALERARTAAGDAERSIANRDFHRGLYARCGNPLLVTTLDGLRDQTALVSVSAWARRSSWESEAEEHAAILDAATRGDAATAAELTARHIQDFVDALPREEGGLQPR